jgi:CheY-like chemotaxis protein
LDRPSQPPAPFDQRDRNRPEILLVDDVALNRQVISLMLEASGHTCETAENGKEALATLKARSFDLVLMDCTMPVMDGWEATRRIRRGEAGAKTAEIVIIALTANAMAGDRDLCLAAGMNDYLSKPIRREALALKLAQHFGAEPAGEDDTPV